MGKLPGLNNLKKERVDLLADEPMPTIEIKEEKEQAVNKNDKMIEKLKDKKIERQNDRKATKATKNSEMKVIGSKVSAEFKSAVSIYCIKNDIKEIDLIAEALNIFLESDTLLAEEYNTDCKGSDTGKTIYGRYLPKFKKEVLLFAKMNGKTEGFVVAQAVAKKIGWKKYN